MRYQDLIAKLSQVRNNAIGSIDTESKVTLTGGQKNPMQGRITKKTTGGSVIFFGNCKSNGYANMVTKKRKESGDLIHNDKYIPKKRIWGERIKNTPLVAHKGNMYVELIYLHAPKSSYFLDEKSIEKSKIEGLKESRKTSKDSVVLRVLKLDTVTKLKMGELSV